MARSYSLLLSRPALLALLLLLAFRPPTPALAQGEELRWERLDVEITVLPSGDFWVQETHVIRFISGDRDYLIFEIPANRLTSISDVQAWEDGEPCITQREYGQYEERCEVSVRYDQGIGLGEYEEVYRIHLLLPTPRPRALYTYEIRYLVHGGLRYYEGGDQLWWKAVRTDRLAPVLASQVTVRLPEGASAEKAAAYSAYATVSGIGTNAVVFEAQEVLDRDQELEVRAQFPHGVVAGTAPTWQQLQEAKPFINLASGTLGGLTALGGLLGVLWLWQRRRRRLAALAIDYRTEPPSDMPPGMAAALVDEEWDRKRVVATLLDLARRGYLRIEERVAPDLVWTDHILHRTGKPEDDLLPYERMVLSRAVGQKGTCPVDDLGVDGYRFYVTKVEREVYSPLVRDGYFRISPATVRTIYNVLGFTLLVLGLTGGPTAYIILEVAAKESIGGVVWPFVGLGVVAIAFFLAVDYVWVKSRRGEEEAAPWLAFQRYLEGELIGGDFAQFEAYLPYAVAFGTYPTEWARRFPHLVEVPALDWYTFSWKGGKGRSTGAPEGLPPLKSLSQARRVSELEAFAQELDSFLESALFALRPWLRRRWGSPIH
ncbi:MAG: DUF2207 domain-containing protein [Thermoflexales bacterium]|nr:DUF2207 domain-containing protein [Thermoflexales bacterium]